MILKGVLRSVDRTGALVLGSTRWLVNNIIKEDGGIRRNEMGGVSSSQVGPSSSWKQVTPSVGSWPNGEDVFSSFECYGWNPTPADKPDPPVS